jgi:hypothetical protein
MMPTLASIPYLLLTDALSHRCQPAGSRESCRADAASIDCRAHCQSGLRTSKQVGFDHGLVLPLSGSVLWLHELSRRTFGPDGCGCKEDRPESEDALTFSLAFRTRRPLCEHCHELELVGIRDICTYGCSRVRRVQAFKALPYPYAAHRPTWSAESKLDNRSLQSLPPVWRHRDHI